MKRIVVLVLMCACASIALATEPEKLPPAAASRLAARLANDDCKHRFGTSPFGASSGRLRFVDGRWKWHAAAGYGYCDLRAEVSFTQSGSDRSVRVNLLDSTLGKQLK